MLEITETDVLHYPRNIITINRLHLLSQFASQNYAL